MGEAISRAQQSRRFRDERRRRAQAL